MSFLQQFSLNKDDTQFRCQFQQLSLHYVPSFYLAGLFQHWGCLSISCHTWHFFHQGQRENNKHTYSNPNLISSLKMTEEKDHMWRKSLYNGLEKKKKKMTRTHAITPPSGARTKSPKETPHKHSICSGLLKMCSVSHLLYLWCISSGKLW